MKESIPLIRRSRPPLLGGVDSPRIEELVNLSTVRVTSDRLKMLHQLAFKTRNNV